MEHYSKSLGVTCEFCHYHDKLRDTWDMASDVKGEKLIARKMMTMTSEINKKYFAPEEGAANQQDIQTITCFTCHKGKEIPDDMPAKDSLNKK